VYEAGIVVAARRGDHVSANAMQGRLGSLAAGTEGPG
jgi:hypothetical protein